MLSRASRGFGVGEGSVTRLAAMAACRSCGAFGRASAQHGKWLNLGRPFVRVMDVAVTPRYDLDLAGLWQLVLVYVTICAIAQVVAIPVSWMLFPRVRDLNQARGEPGGDLWAADAICLLLFSVALPLNHSFSNSWVRGVLQEV